MEITDINILYVKVNVSRNKFYVEVWEMVESIVRIWSLEQNFSNTKKDILKPLTYRQHETLEMNDISRGKCVDGKGSRYRRKV